MHRPCRARCGGADVVRCVRGGPGPSLHVQKARNPLKQDHIARLLEPVVRDLGLVLWGVEYLPQRRKSLLRLYIDAEGRAVTVDDCEAVSREVAAVLDVEDPIAGPYTLEVSSPGLDRPFFAAEQLAPYAGRQARVLLAAAVGGRRRLQGRILGVDGAIVRIEQDGAEVAIEWRDVLKASLVPDLFAYAPKSPRPRRGGSGSAGPRRARAGGGSNP